jgi:hypothetical protein
MVIANKKIPHNKLTVKFMKNANLLSLIKIIKAIIINTTMAIGISEKINKAGVFEYP